MIIHIEMHLPQSFSRQFSWTFLFKAAWFWTYIYLPGACFIKNLSCTAIIVTKYCILLYHWSVMLGEISDLGQFYETATSSTIGQLC